MIPNHPCTASHHPICSGKVQGFQIDTIKAREEKGDLTQHTDNTVIYITRKTVPFCYVSLFPAAPVAAVANSVLTRFCIGQCESLVVDEIVHPFDSWPIP